MLRPEIEPKRRRPLLGDAHVERKDKAAEGNVAQDEFLFCAPALAVGSSERKRGRARADLGRGRAADVDQPHALGGDAIFGKRPCRADEQAFQCVCIEIGAGLRKQCGRLECMAELTPARLWPVLEEVLSQWQTANRCA